jgi:Zn-dependent protease with chaperone function
VTLPDPFDLASTYAWRVALHSLLAGLACYAWTRQQRLRPGRSKRWLLAALLVLPLLTAAAPGRRSAGFRDERAWFDSARALALPLRGGGELRVAHVLVPVGLATLAVTLWQELLPVLRRRPRGAGEPPAEVAAAARALPGWERVAVRRVAGTELLAAAGGWPWRPRLLLSDGLLAALEPEPLLAVVRHEHAHATPRRWWPLHLLFATRLLQAYNPVALWLFREYAVETEIACDRLAVAGGDPRPLARALLAVYEGTDPRDRGARAVLRRRVDLLLGREELGEERLDLLVVSAATLLLALLLPWVV